MMLSEILNRFFVLPLNQSELVCFSIEDHPEHGEIIVVTWKDSDTLDSFRQEFVDQEVDLSDATRFKGQFNVTPINGSGPVAFVALDTVALEKTEALDADFLRHIASVCRAAYDLCQPKPQRTPEDPREHYGELCLLGLKDIANVIKRRLAAAEDVQTIDGCHCGTCTCNPNMTPAVRYDLSPAQKEGVIREHLIRLGWTPPAERDMGDGDGQD